MADSDIKGVKPYIASARSAIELKTVFVSEDFIILEKPAGILVHPARKLNEGDLPPKEKLSIKSSTLPGNNFSNGVHPDQHHQGKTLVDLVAEEYPEIKNIGDSARPGIVHRLDKDVSGLMVIARSQKFYQYIVQQFTEDKVKKEYLALVYGRPDSSVGKIDLPLARTKDGKIVAVQYHGKIKNQKDAVTEYETVKNYSQYSLLKVRPLTGRTNQIRVHLRAINCPIVGDLVYGFKDKNEGDKLGRIFLHAAYLGFYDLNNTWQEFKSDLPDELKKILEKLI
ncbi:MAG: RNA pseudouridine synthase [Candidatus Parcubacteria bacterium]|nr:RNA pseudouridine synthase [Candidatus Parcubacteria bacterium]